jgi:hypothetical protein
MDTSKSQQGGRPFHLVGQLKGFEWPQRRDQNNAKHAETDRDEDRFSFFNVFMGHDVNEKFYS